MSYDYKDIYSGSIKRTATGESLFFSPKPIPSTSIKQGELGTQSEVLMINDTVMDIGSPQNGAVLQARISAMLTSLMFSVFVFIILFISFLSMARESYNYNYYYYITKSFREYPNGLIFSFICLILFVWAFLFKSAFWDKRKSLPVRFNRQKREVAFYTKKSLDPIIVPWEDVICWGSSDKLFTGSAVGSLAMFGLAFMKEDSDQYWTIKMPVPLMMSAQRRWETIRCFMDESPEYWPRVGTEETRETYYQEKTEFFNSVEFKFSKSKKIKTFWFHFYRIITWGKFPFWFAEIENKISTPKHAKVVEEWSKSIPESEWAKPSQELIDLREKALKHYQNGGSFYDLDLGR